MSWPTDTITTTYLDSSTDDPSQARAELYTVATKVKDVIAGRASSSGVCDLDSSTLVPIARIPDQARYRQHKNLLMNGNFAITQRGTTVSATDNTPSCCDRWKALGDSTTVWTNSYTDLATLPTAADRAIQVIPLTSNKKFAVLQFLETRLARMLQDKTVTFSVYLKGDANYDDVRIALLSWTGTANAPTDPVSSWGSSGTNPTWATSWTAENTPADLSITTGWVKYSVTAALDTAAINNLAVVVFSNSTTPTSSDSLYIALAQLEVGSEGTDFDIRQRADELQMCERFYQAGAGANDAYWNGNTTSGSTYKYGVRFRCTMAKTPVVTLTNASASGFGTTPGTPAVTTEGFQEGRAATSTANASYFSSDWTSDGEL